MPKLRVDLALGALLALWSFCPALAGADTNLRIGSMSADGQEVRDMNCALKSGGFFAGLQVVGALAKSKKTFDACAPAGAAFAVDVVFGGGKIASAKVTGSSEPGKDACVTRALEKTRTDLGGKCSLVLLVGAAEGAKRAVAALPKKDKAEKEPAGEAGAPGVVPPPTGRPAPDKGPERPRPLPPPPT